MGMSERRRPGRALPIDHPSRTLGASTARRRMPDGSPAVQTVTLRASIASALGSVSTRMAAMTRSALASGSPMPWNTTPCTRPIPRARSPRRTTRTCSTISQTSRLRDSPSRPVAQNAHASAHPTCELTHTEKRPARSSGIRTASTT